MKPDCQVKNRERYWLGITQTRGGNYAYLTKREEQGHVAADALLLEVLTGSDALPRGGNLHMQHTSVTLLQNACSQSKTASIEANLCGLC